MSATDAKSGFISYILLSQSGVSVTLESVLCLIQTTLPTGEGTREATQMPPHDTNGTTSRTPLIDHLRAFKARSGLSHNQMAKMAKDPETGRPILVQWLIDMLENRVSRAPELWRLRALSAALATRDNGTVDMDAYRRCLEEIKRLAAAQWYEMGELLEVQTSDGSIVTVSVPPGLSEDDREKIRRWAEQMARDLAGDGNP